ncbi:stage 0 sporulation protein [bacterium]|nr:stage 0 sporulation protein [bacterium]
MIKYAVKYLKNTFVPLKNVNIEEDNDSCSSILDNKLVLVRTEKGEEVLKAFRVCSKVAEQFEKSEKETEAFEFIRIMTQEDLMIYEDIKQEETTSFFKCKELIKKHKLNMNLVQCRLTFDKRKISFYYTAPERVDFRELLKELTQVFKKMRIDLRHIGVRDESSIMDGTGICGKPFCCSSYLRKFESINVKLAKDQGMPIAPSKISGTCGRLLCCLTYEYENYIEAAKGMPPVGSTVMTPVGLGKICYIQFLNNSVAVKFEDGKIKEFGKDEIEMVEANINVDIDIPRITNYAPDEKVDAKQLKQLEDDRNSSTGNV